MLLPKALLSTSTTSLTIWSPNGFGDSYGNGKNNNKELLLPIKDNLIYNCYSKVNLISFLLKLNFDHS